MTLGRSLYRVGFRRVAVVALGSHLYSVFLLAVRVSSISSPFFIQKLSSWAPWAELRLHCRVMGGLWESEGRVVCSEEAMVGSETSSTGRWRTDLRLDGEK